MLLQSYLHGVSRSTLYGKCKVAGYLDTLQTDVSDENVQLLANELKLQFSNAGAGGDSLLGRQVAVATGGGLLGRHIAVAANTRLWFTLYY